MQNIDQKCSSTSGKFSPHVDRNLCEGKEDCIRVCPFNVFEMGVLSASDRAELSILGKLRAWAHGHRQVFVVNPMECHACNRCLSACPEKALKLVPVTAR